MQFTTLSNRRTGTSPSALIFLGLMWIGGCRDATPTSPTPPPTPTVPATPATPATPTGSGSLSILGFMTPQGQAVHVSRGGVPVTDAEVTVNGFRIPHCCGTLYSGNLPTAIPAGGTLNLRVISGGATFDATGEVTPTPTITAPAAGSTVARTDSVRLAWNSLTDPDWFEVCLNCWENSLDGATYAASGTEREFKIAPGVLMDYGTGAVIAVYAYKSNFFGSAGSPGVTSNVLFVAKSPDARITVKH